MRGRARYSKGCATLSEKKAVSLGRTEASRCGGTATLAEAGERRWGASVATSARLPSVIRVADWPQLQRLAWQLRSDSEVTPREALDLYERNWRHVDQRALSVRERAFLDALLAKFGRERLLV
jgi:hypothetical protein